MPPKPDVQAGWFRDIPILSELRETDFKEWLMAMQDSRDLAETTNPILDASYAAVLRIKTKGAAREQLNALAPADRNDPVRIIDLLKSVCCPNIHMEQSKIYDDLHVLRQTVGENIRDYVSKCDSLRAKQKELGAAISPEHFAHRMLCGLL